MTEPVDLDAMPLPDADRYIQTQMRLYQDRLRWWRARRGERLLRELESGKSPAEVAVAIGASTAVVYGVIAEARRGRAALGPSPEVWWSGLTPDEREAFLVAAKRPYPLPRDLAEKMRAAGVVVAEAGFSELYPVLPEPYTTFLRMMAQESSD